MTKEALEIEYLTYPPGGFSNHDRREAITKEEIDAMRSEALDYFNANGGFTDDPTMIFTFQACGGGIIAFRVATEKSWNAYLSWKVKQGIAA